MTIRHSPPSENSWPFNFVNRNNRLERLVPFGPGGQKMCGEGRGVIQNAGRQVLEWVANQSEVQLVNLLPMLRLIEPRVRASYPDNLDPVNVLGDGQLMQIALDTCLFLLVVFTMLLGDDLGFPSQHLLLGHGRVNDSKEMWLRSIFFVGNQIPFAMVDKLMESFSSLGSYRTRLRKHKPPSNLLEAALFEFVTSDSQSSMPPPSDVMHCLRAIILNQFSIWTGEGAPGTMSSFSKEGYMYSPSPNSRPGKVTVNSPFVDINGEIWLKLIVNILNEYETVHELQPKASESLHALVQSTDDVQAPLSHDGITEVEVECLSEVLELSSETPRFNPNLRQREEIQSYKWLIGILIMISAVPLIIAVAVYTAHLDQIRGREEKKGTSTSAAYIEFANFSGLICHGPNGRNDY